MQISDEGKIGIALALLGLGGGGALFVLPHPYADYVGWTLILISVLGLLLLWLHHSKGRRGKPMWPQYLMILSGVLFFVGLIAFLQVNVTPPKQKETGADFQPPSLAEYFAKDFNFLSIDRTAQIRVQNPSNRLDQIVEVKIRTFRDFGSNAEFISVFVPIFSDMRLVEATEQFIENLKPQIKQAQEEAKLIGVQSKIPGTAFANSKDLVFSGRVYLYTMNSLDPVQLGHLVESYRKDGMYLDLRGSDYLFFQSRQNH
jgi:hypothetical protein